MTCKNFTSTILVLMLTMSMFLSYGSFKIFDLQFYIFILIIISSRFDSPTKDGILLFILHSGLKCSLYGKVCFKRLLANL